MGEDSSSRSWTLRERWLLPPTVSRFATRSWMIPPNAPNSSGASGALTDWDGPEEGERPSAYLVIFSDGEPAKFTWTDCGIAAQTIALAATEAGAGACMMASFSPSVVFDVVGEGAAGMTPLLVLALGIPSETCVLEAAEPGEDLDYWRGPDGVHHVPKRTLASVLIQGKE